MAKSAKKTAIKAEVNVVEEIKENVLTYEMIVDRFKSIAAKAKPPVDARVAAQIKLYGDVDGILYVLIANGVAVVEPFDYRGADIEIDADAAAFASVINGKKSISLAICDRDIKMQGNAGKAIVLASAVF